jgi:hypothetical protein
VEIMDMTLRPTAGIDYPPSLADYMSRIAADEDIIAVLGDQLDQVLARFKNIPEARGDYRYAPGKWSIKEIVGHLSDAERIFAYRALRIGRGDITPLPGFEEEAYVPEMRAGERVLAEYVDEWGTVRRATIALFRNLPSPAWNRRGVANDQPISVQAIAYAIVGHVRHHLDVLGSRYEC